MADIDLTPTEEMASNAARGLELREKHGRGGTAVGVARARDIKNRKNLSPDTVRRMHSFFSRHAGNETGGEDDAGYISFLLWGGAAGRSWAKRKSAQLDKDENAMSDTRKEIMERLGMAAHPGAKAAFGYQKTVTNLLEEHGVDPEDFEFRNGDLVLFNHHERGRVEQALRDGLQTGEIRSAPRIVSSFSRPGAKAKMAKPQFRVRKLHGGYLAVDMNQGSGWERYDTTHEEVFDGLEDYERGYQKAYDRGLRWSGGSWRIPSTKASRPGAKAKFSVSDAEAYERGVKMSQMAALIPNFREGVQANPWFQLGYQMGVKHGPKAGGMMSQAKREFPAVAARLNASRPGAKAKMGRWTLDASEGWGDLSKQWTATINGTQWAIVVEGATGNGSLMRVQPGRAPQTIKRGSVEQLKRYAETLKSSRPGAKAKMAYAPSESDMKKWMKGWTLRLPMVPDAGIRHFNSFEEAKRYGDAKCGGFSCEISYDGRRVASKGALSPEGSWTKHSRKGTKTGMRRMTQQETSHLKAWIGKNFRTTEEMMDAMTKMEMVFEEDSEHWESRSWPEVAKAAGVWSRPGAKAKMAKSANEQASMIAHYRAVTELLEQARDKFRRMNDATSLDEKKKIIAEVKYYSAAQEASIAQLKREGLIRSSRFGAKVHNAIREGEKVSASDDAVSRKIRKLMDEGKPQKQAVAIALDLERRGEL